MVQTLPSPQGKSLFVCVQPPRPSQVSVVQPLPSSQLTTTPDLQLPCEHASPTVQLLPSSHAAELAKCSQPLAASQMSSVHTLPSSSHHSLAPGTQAPAAHMSLIVQRLPS